MIQFRVYFTHLPTMTVEASSGEEARRIGSKIAQDNQTRVLKVKRVKGASPCP